jgi:hypothetical protein
MSIQENPLNNYNLKYVIHVIKKRRKRGPDDYSSSLVQRSHKIRFNLKNGFLNTIKTTIIHFSPYHPHKINRSELYST